MCTFHTSPKSVTSLGRFAVHWAMCARFWKLRTYSWKKFIYVKTYICISNIPSLNVLKPHATDLRWFEMNTLFLPSSFSLYFAVLFTTYKWNLTFRELLQDPDARRFMYDFFYLLCKNSRCILSDVSHNILHLNTRRFFSNSLFCSTCCVQPHSWFSVQ
jgi:hypothetical protein